MKPEQVITAIGVIIEWYGKVKVPNPAELLNQYKRLNVYLWYYAEYVAETKGEYNQKYFIRKIETIREKDRLVKSKLAVNKAEIEAMLSTETQYMLEIEAESMAYKADLMLKQANKVSDCMMMHLSQLRKEQEQSRNQ